MFKRFTDCHKWQDPWFRKLPTEYKLFWSYICDHCDNAGVWKVDMDTAAYFIGHQIAETEALQWISGRVSVMNSEYWLVNKFVEFQFGVLSIDSPLHKAVLKLIDKHTLSLPYPYPSTRVQEKDKEKDKVKDKEKAVDVKPLFRFSDIWNRYPRKEGKRGAQASFRATVQTLEDWQKISRALDNYLLQIRKEGTEPKYIKMGSTWFNNWQDEIYQGDQNASHGGKELYSPMARSRAEAEAQKLRENATAGAISTGLGDLPDVQRETDRSS